MNPSRAEGKWVARGLNAWLVLIPVLSLAAAIATGALNQETRLLDKVHGTALESPVRKTLGFARLVLGAE